MYSIDFPWVLISCESWHRVVPRHSTAWLNWFPYFRRYIDAIQGKYRKGTYSVSIVTSVPWDMGTSTTAFLAVLWAARLVASFEEIWDAVAGSGLYNQTSLPFWRAMTGCISIGSLATIVDWLFLSPYNEPITCSYNYVIEKGLSEGEKRDFPLLGTQRRRSHFSLPVLPYFPCLLSSIVWSIERLSLHCSSNWEIMALINWSLNAIDTIFSTRKLGSGEPACPDGTFAAGYTMDAWERWRIVCLALLPWRTLKTSTYSEPW